MIVKNLASSSDGNSTYIRTEEHGILLDVGIAKKHIMPHVEDAPIDAIFITHEHGDHIKSAGPLGRALEVPIYVRKESYKKYEHDEWFEKYAYDKDEDINGRKPKFVDCEVKFIDLGTEYEIGDLKVTAFSTSHDSVDSVGYIITDTTSGKKLGYVTDTGFYTPVIRNYLKGCDAYMLESDYDVDELAACNAPGYDDLLKARISSTAGHLSNQQTLDFISEIGDLDRIDFIVFCHLSSNTNSPELILKQASDRFPNYSEFHVAPSEKTFTL